MAKLVRRKASTNPSVPGETVPLEAKADAAYGLPRVGPSTRQNSGPRGTEGRSSKPGTGAPSPSRPSPLRGGGHSRPHGRAGRHGRARGPARRDLTSSEVDFTPQLSRSMARETARRGSRVYREICKRSFAVNTTVYRHFGSWPAALEAVGLQRSPASATTRSPNVWRRRRLGESRGGNAIGGHGLQALWSFGRRACSRVSPAFSRRNG